LTKDTIPKNILNNELCSKNLFLWVLQLFLPSLKMPSYLIILQLTKLTFRFHKNLRLFLMSSMTTRSIWHMGKKLIQSHKFPIRSSTHLFKKMKFMFQKILRFIPMLILPFISPCKMSMMRLSEHKGIWLMNRGLFWSKYCPCLCWTSHLPALIPHLGLLSRKHKLW